MSWEIMRVNVKWGQIVILKGISSLPVLDRNLMLSLFNIYLRPVLSLFFLIE